MTEKIIIDSFPSIPLTFVTPFKSENHNNICLCFNENKMIFLGRRKEGNENLQQIINNKSKIFVKETNEELIIESVEPFGIIDEKLKKVRFTGKIAVHIKNPQKDHHWYYGKTIGIVN